MSAAQVSVTAALLRRYSGIGPVASGLSAMRVICSVREVVAGRLAPVSVFAKRVKMPGLPPTPS
jgi:hypothetical protein